MPRMTGIVRVPWVPLGNTFPPTLNKASAPELLKPGETPAAYGIATTRQGYLSTGACPGSDTGLAKTYSVGVNTYNWWYNRLWRISGNQIVYGAPNYHDSYFAQGLGVVNFLEDANDLLALVPVGSGSLAVFKSTCAFVLRNADDHAGNFQKSDAIEEAYIAAATRAVALDGVCYFSNADGLFALDEAGKVTEITLPVRGSLTPFSNSALAADYQTKRIIGATDQWCYDAAYQKLFDYSTAGFLYTTPSLRMVARGYEGNPFNVDRIAFEVFFADTSDGELTLQTKCGDRDWFDTVTVSLSHAADALARVEVPLDQQQNGRTFALRITALSDNVYIRSITASVSDFMMEGYAE